MDSVEITHYKSCIKSLLNSLKYSVTSHVGGVRDVPRQIRSTECSAAASRPITVCRAVYWQESGDTIRITIQGLQYDILRYCKQGDILGYFLF